IPQVQRLGQAPEPVRMVGHAGDGQQLVDAAQRDYEVIVADRPPVAFRVGHAQLPTAGVDIGDGARTCRTRRLTAAIGTATGRGSKIAAATSGSNGRYRK